MQTAWASALGRRMWRPWRLSGVRWAAGAVGLFAAGGVVQVADGPPVVWWVLYLACYAAGGWAPALAGLRALRGGTLDVDLLMIVAAVAAVGIGQVFDGALLIVIFALSGALEEVATTRTAASVRALLTLTPESATRVGGDGGDWSVEVVDPSQLAVGDVLLVRPGERIAADGDVVDGMSEVDQASITGEPMPVVKQAGAEVFAGTVNGTGALRVRVSRPAAETVLARIVALVEQASETKARRQLLIETVERRYSIAVVAATVALFSIPLALGQALQPTLLRAMTFMIVASPCAVVLATMPPLLAAIANAGRHGVLVKSAVVFEQLAATTTVAFDKTGTLTVGRPRVVDVLVVDRSSGEPGELLALAAAAEHDSEHPVGAAVVAAARDRRLRVPAATEFASMPGRGVRALVAGRTVQVAGPALLAELGAGSPASAAAATVQAGEAGGHTTAIVTVDGHPAGVIVFDDRVRDDATATVAAVAACGCRTAVISGDNAGAATRVAAATGVGIVQAGLLPSDKVDVVRRLQRDGEHVLVVGDGVNDAPALAAADVGIAMGARGADVALETADAVVAVDDLTAVATLIGLARRARGVVTANLVIAAAVIVALVVWDLAGTLPLPLGVAGHETSTVLVALNGLRLLRRRAWPMSGHVATPVIRPRAAARASALRPGTLVREGE